MVKTGPSNAEEFAVLVHKWAHEILHQHKPVEVRSKTVLETEAEAVVYVVCAAIGLDVNTACSDYIRLYEGGKETLLTTLERIKNTASGIMQLAGIDEHRRDGLGS